MYAIHIKTKKGSRYEGPFLVTGTLGMVRLFMLFLYFLVL
jgi:hypothetical protein